MTDQQRPLLGESAGYGRKTWWPALALWGVCTVTLGLRIPIQSGRGFRREVGRRSDLKPDTIPN